MPMIAKLIYDGATAEDLEMPDIQYQSRVDTLNMFLEYWDGVDFEASFLKFIVRLDEEDTLTARYVDGAPNSTYEHTGKDYGQEADEEEDLSFGKMFTGLAKNLKAISKSGISMVGNDEHQERFNICLDCKYITEKARCMKCGCFMKLKSRFKAMHCPMEKW